MNYLRRQFKRDKIIVLGHSWGSVLGLWLAHEHPELISAYVGTGQVVNMEQNDATAYQDALQEARRLHNEPAVKQLESIAPYSNTDGEKGAIARHWEGELLGPPPGARFIDGRRILLDLVSAPDYSLLDDYGFIRGQSLSLEIFLPQLARVNLTQLGAEFRVPVFFFEGRQDPYCRPSLVWDYFQAIQAPHKEFVWFDHAGHFPFFEDKQKFLNELVQKVLPPGTSAIA